MIRSHGPICVCVCVERLERAVPVNKMKNVSLDMPLRMATGRIQNVAAECFMTEIPERLADSLRLLARDQDPQTHLDPQIS